MFLSLFSSLFGGDMLLAVNGSTISYYSTPTATVQSVTAIVGEIRRIQTEMEGTRVWQYECTLKVREADLSPPVVKTSQFIIPESHATEKWGVDPRFNHTDESVFIEVPVFRREHIWKGGEGYREERV